LAVIRWKVSPHCLVSEPVKTVLPVSGVKCFDTVVKTYAIISKDCLLGYTAQSTGRNSVKRMFLNSFHNDKRCGFVHWCVQTLTLIFHYLCTDNKPFETGNKHIANCQILIYGDSVVEENSSIFSLIRMHWLLSARACGQ